MDRNSLLTNAYVKSDLGLIKITSVFQGFLSLNTVEEIIANIYVIVLRTETIILPLAL